MEQIAGKLIVVVFHNEETLYSVIKVKPTDDVNSKQVTLTGNFPIPDENKEYLYKGEYITHPKFGKQFVVSEYEEILPSNKDSIIKYLSSSLFPKIGIKTAEKIYNILGENAIECIKKDGDVLNHIVTIDQKQIIIDGLNKSNYFDEAVKLFVTHGLSLKMLLKIQTIYKDQMINIIKQNPYRLIEDIEGIGFKTIDDFALKLGVNYHDENRIKACLIHCLSIISFSESDTYTSYGRIMDEFNKIIKDIDEDSKKYYLNVLIKEGKIYKEEEKYFLMQQYIAEEGNAKILTKFIKKIMTTFEKSQILELLETIEKKSLIKYDENQKEAIINCLDNGISIITGGPGTGKTTIVKAIIQIYQEIIANNKICICAPTGRASKRLTEVTGLKASTIHSLLKWDLQTNTFSVNENNPLYVDLLIIDEFSMVDNYLFYQLLKACEHVGQIILIGDEDQLPSVGPGNVLGDLINSGLINVVRLNKIYRQSSMSNIIKLAHHIKNNEDVSNDFQEDVIFYSTDNYKIKQSVLEYIKIAKNNGYDNDDIQVLAPMYQGVNGIDNLNELLQNYFNPHDENIKELKVGRVIYRENDKILQLKNQNEDNVFNGDIGTLLEIKEENNITNSKIYVGYDSGVVEYIGKDFINITHAYCISIHKSQGNEYPLIILPICFAYQRMLVKNLIYTAITRAKSKLIIIGDYRAFLYGISNTNYKVRKTTLKEKLLKYVNPL